MDKKLEDEVLCAVHKIVDILNESFKVEFMNTKIRDLAIFHFGFGTWIRNTILTEDSQIYRLFLENGFEQKDDMSAVMIRELYKYLWQ